MMDPRLVGADRTATPGPHAAGALVRFLAAVALALCAGTGVGTSYAPPEFPGNIVGVGDSVVFAQAAGPVMELDACTGAVRAHLQANGIESLAGVHGALLVGESRESVIAVDLATSRVAWQASGHKPVLHDRYVLHSDLQWQSIECRETTSGALLWRCPGSLFWSAARDGRLAKRAMGGYSVELIDIATGREIFSKSLDEPDASFRVFLGSDRVVSVGFGPSRGTSGGVWPGPVIEWDFTGREVARHMRTAVQSAGSDSYFCDGRYLGTDGWVHPRDAVTGAPDASFTTLFPEPTTVTLSCGILAASPMPCRWRNLSNFHGVCLLQFRSGGTSWTVASPDYCGTYAVACAGGCLVVGRPSGEVEALELASGRSLWVFRPRRNRTVHRYLVTGVGAVFSLPLRVKRAWEDRRNWQSWPSRSVRIFSDRQNPCDVAYRRWRAEADNCPHMVPSP